MGKPLISDAQLRAIHETMLRLREAQTAELRNPALAELRRYYDRQPVALLAATLLQLHTSDVVVAEGPQPMAGAALVLAHEQSFHPAVQPAFLHVPPKAGAAMFAAGHAMAQSRSSQPGDRAPITVALLRHDAAVAEAMQLAGEHLLPLLILLRDPPGAARRALESPPNVEIVNVDADDAVACCRVMQESLLRVRNRWGAVVMRGLSLPGAPEAVTALEAHLRKRGLPVNATG